MKKQGSASAQIGMFMLVFAGVNGQDGATIYNTYCAGCHGTQLQGASATPLIKTDWKYGRANGSISRNIKFGIPSTDMVAWGKVLNDEQIKAVTEFVVASQTVPSDARRPIPATLTTKDYTIKVEQLVSAGLRTPGELNL